MSLTLSENTRTGFVMTRFQLAYEVPTRLHKLMLDILCVQVMTGGDNSCVTIWNVDHQQITDSLRQHTAWIWSIQFTETICLPVPLIEQ